MSFINILKALLHSMLQLFGFAKKTITNKLSIYVKTSTGSTLTVNLDPQWDIGNVKEIVAPQLGLKPEEVKIIFAGKELENTTTIAECDIGQQSILHAVRMKTKSKLNLSSNVENTLEEESTENLASPSKSSPNTTEPNDALKPGGQSKAHFYVFCPTCKNLKPGKLRVRCHFCKSGAFTVHSDPQNWSDVLEPRKITGTCENDENICANVLNNAEPTFAQFYFKCAEHVSQGETDQAVALNLIRSNIHNVPCLSCADNCDPVLVFPCPDSHVICIDCFRIFCTSRLTERQFREHKDLGYTLGCPIGCPESFIKETHHFRLLNENLYAQYQRFATEEYVLQAGGVFCPKPDCGMGIIADVDCRTVTCINGCGFVFCRRCLNGNHIGECKSPEQSATNGENFKVIDPSKAFDARWDEASRYTIKVSTKPCPKCQTPTERDGGCMHMICTRSGCEYHWCWVCQTEWTRDCMGSHWFG